MAWLTLLLGGAVLVLGILGQIFGIKRRAPAHPEDRRMGRLVITVGSAVIGLWLIAFSAIRLLHMHTVGHW
jgi:hypothetical protein